MKPGIALIGCGAIAQFFYLPALAKKRAEFGEVWLVDPDERVLCAAASLIDGRPVRSLADLPGNIDLAIIAAPNSLHFRLAQEAISRGAHLLIEKPVVIWPEEAGKLVALAAAHQRTIAVNQTRRFFPCARELRREIQANAFGKLKGITHLEGHKRSWPFESGAAFHRSAQRTGVIMDLGVHVIDFYQFLFEPDWRFISASHDGFRGPEGLAEIDLEADGAPVSIRLSRYYKQTNVARLRFENADVTVDLDDLNTYTLRTFSGSARRVTANPAIDSYRTLAGDVLSDFLAAAGGHGAPACPVRSSLPVIAILDEIYRSAVPWPAEIGAA
jgi:predicted dehydrogenase